MHVTFEYMSGQLFMYIQVSPLEIQTPAHQNPVSCSMTACHYSSSSFVSLCFNASKEKFGLCFKTPLLM